MNPVVINAFQMFSGGLLTLLNITYEIFYYLLQTYRHTGYGSRVSNVNTLIIAYLVQTTAQKYVGVFNSFSPYHRNTFGTITSVILLGDPITIKLS